MGLTELKVDAQVPLRVMCADRHRDVPVHPKPLLGNPWHIG